MAPRHTAVLLFSAAALLSLLANQSTAVIYTPSACGIGAMSGSLAILQGGVNRDGLLATMKVTLYSSYNRSMGYLIVDGGVQNGTSMVTSVLITDSVRAKGTTLATLPDDLGYGEFFNLALGGNTLFSLYNDYYGNGGDMRAVLRVPLNQSMYERMNIALNRVAGNAIWIIDESLSVVAGGLLVRARDCY